MAEYIVKMKCKRCGADGSVDLGEGMVSCPDWEGDGNLGEGVIEDLKDDIADILDKLEDIKEKLDE